MIKYACGHNKDLGIGDFESKIYVCTDCANKNKVFDFGHTTTAEESAEFIKKEMRRSYGVIFTLPNWYGEGGTIEVWINNDNSFECMDNRIVDADIRSAMISLAESQQEGIK
jgi:hypothetical protein